MRRVCVRPRFANIKFHLRQFAAHPDRIGVGNLARVSPAILSSFIAHYGPRVAWSTLRNACGTLRVFFRYLHREGVAPKDLSPLIEFPQSFRYSGIPRSIPWEQIEAVLEGIDRRSISGKRDYGMLRLLSPYGLRACEVAALTLDDTDWRRERLRIRDRKAGNTTTYPLSTVVGAALLDYIKHARPDAPHGQIFLRTTAPLDPIGSAALLHALDHQIADHLATDGAGASAPVDHLAIAGVQAERNVHDLIQARDLEAIGRPAGIRMDRANDPIVSATWWPPRVSLK